MRMAESLDRSRAGAVLHATLRREGEKKLILEMKAAGDCHLELWSAESNAEAVKKAFGKKLKVRVRQTRRATKNLKVQGPLRA